MRTASTAALPPRYDPHDIEGRWYAIWEERGYFHPSAGEGPEPYTIVIPPPNVTGVLHMGHGLNYWNIRPLVRIPAVEELNIGHAIVSRAVLVGMERAVREMKEAMKEHWPNRKTPRTP